MKTIFRRTFREKICHLSSNSTEQGVNYIISRRFQRNPRTRFASREWNFYSVWLFLRRIAATGLFNIHGGLELGCRAR
ncbi:hypothetical protein BDR22DRAFT_849471 [Usnea florida]